MTAFNPSLRILLVASPDGRTSVLASPLESLPGFTIDLRPPADLLPACQRRPPDLVLIDVYSPPQHALDLIRTVMRQVAVPLVAVVDDTVDDSTRQALTAAGALSVIARPGLAGDSNVPARMAALAETLQLMSEVRVVRRHERSHRPAAAAAEALVSPRTPRIVAIGASTGGPAVLQSIVHGLPADFPLPIVIVQHIAAGFLSGMIGWLQSSSALTLRVACDREPLAPGSVYFAPDHHQMALERDTVVLGPNLEHDGHCPSISWLFRSVACEYGSAAIGVLLTGMGRDGAQGLLTLHQAGAVTIAQDRASCVVYGMPARAGELGAVSRFLAPARIPSVLMNLAGMTEDSQ